MEKLILYAVGGLAMSIFYICCWFKIANKKIDLKDYKLYLSLIGFVIIGTLTSFYANPMLKMIINSIMMICVAYFCVFKNLKSSIIAVVVTQIVIMIAEMCFVMATSLFIDMKKLSENLYGGLIINVGVALLCFLLMKTGVINKMYNVVSNSIKTLKMNKVIKNSFLMILLASSLTTISYINLSPTLVLILNTTIVILYVIIIFHMTSTQDKFQKISNKYDMSISNLLEYEEIINRNNITMHEMKNLLRTIRGMVINKEDNIDKYIEAAIKEKIYDNNKMMIKTKKIPQGGLRALFYSKLCLMDKNKIPVKLHVDKAIKASDMINLDNEFVLDICKILGVYLDNAIDEVLKTKNPSIMIELYKMDKCICIDITNNFEGIINFDQIDKINYSTKGKGHGYGLVLANELIEKYDELSNEREITSSEFTQILKIKV